MYTLGEVAVGIKSDAKRLRDAIRVIVTPTRVFGLPEQVIVAAFVMNLVLNSPSPREMLNYMSHLGFGNIFCATVAIILGLASGVLSVGDCRTLRDAISLGFVKLWSGFKVISFVLSNGRSANVLVNEPARDGLGTSMDHTSEKLDKGKDRAVTGSTELEPTEARPRRLSEEEKAALIRRRLTEKREKILRERVTQTGIGPSFISEGSENMRTRDRSNHQGSDSIPRRRESHEHPPDVPTVERMPTVELSLPTSIPKQTDVSDGMKIIDEVANKTIRENTDGRSKTRESEEDRAKRKEEAMRLYMIRRADNHRRHWYGAKPSDDTATATAGPESTLKATKEQVKEEALGQNLAKAAKMKATAAVITAADDVSDPVAPLVATLMPTMGGERQREARALQNTTLTTVVEPSRRPRSLKAMTEENGADNALVEKPPNPDEGNSDISDSRLKRPTSSSRALSQGMSEGDQSANNATERRTSTTLPPAANARQASVDDALDDENKSRAINLSLLVAADETRHLKHEGTKSLSSNDMAATQTCKNERKSRTTSELPQKDNPGPLESLNAKETARVVTKSRVKGETLLLHMEERLKRKAAVESRVSSQDGVLGFGNHFKEAPTLEVHARTDKVQGEEELRLKRELSKELVPSKQTFENSGFQAPSGKYVLELDQTAAMPSISSSVTPEKISSTFKQDRKATLSQNDVKHSPVAPNDNKDEVGRIKAKQRVKELALREQMKKRAEEKARQEIIVQNPETEKIISWDLLERSKASDPSAAFEEAQKPLKSALKKPSVSFAGIVEPEVNAVPDFFLSKTGPGRAALIPFPRGLYPKVGKPRGNLWFNNVPKDASQLMAATIHPRKKSAA